MGPPLLDNELYDQGLTAGAGGDELRQFGNVMRALLRAKILIALATLLGALAALMYAKGLEPRYTATAQVMIDTRQQESALGSTDAVLPTTTTALESERAVLQSFDLIERVVGKLSLDLDLEFSTAANSDSDPVQSSAGKLLADVRERIGLSAESTEPRAGSPVDPEVKLHQVVDFVAQSLEILQPTNASAVYSINFTSADPVKAALIANSLAETYLQMQRDVKLDRLERANNWLTNRATDLGRQLADVSRQLEVHKSDAPFSSEAGLRNALEERDELSLRLDRAREQQATGQIVELESAIAPLEEQISAQSAHEIEAARISMELDLAETVYARIVGQLSDLQQQGDILGPDAKIVSHARPPLAPSEPKVSLLTAVGGLSAALLCALLVALRELTLNRLRSMSDFEDASNLPVVGAIPRSRQQNAPLNTVLKGRSPDPSVVKSINKLRSSLVASKLPYQVIAFTSSLPGEGKSSTVLMLAQSFSKIGERTLLLDFDVWRSPFRRSLELDGASLAEIAESGGEIDRYLFEVSGSPLWILSAGRDGDELVGLQTSSVLTDAIAKLKGRFDRIVIDLPPVLPVSDLAYMASIADLSLFVAQWNSTPRSAVSSALKTLADVGVTPFGLVATLVRGDRAHAYSDDAFSYMHRRYVSGYYTSTR